MEPVDVGSGVAGGGVLTVLGSVLISWFKNRRNPTPKPQRDCVSLEVCEQRMEKLLTKMEVLEKDIETIDKDFGAFKEVSKERHDNTQKRLEQGRQDFANIREELKGINKNLTELITIAKERGSLFQG